MAELSNPFSRLAKTPAEITAESNEKSLRSLLDIYRRTSVTLDALRRSAPESPLHRSWIDKLEKAKLEYLELAQQLGMSNEEAEAALRSTT